MAAPQALLDPAPPERSVLRGRATRVAAALGDHVGDQENDSVEDRVDNGIDIPDGCDDTAPAPAPTVALDPGREALERTCLTVKRIAHDIGMPRATLEAYRLGTRRMPQSARHRLGTYLAAHAAMLDGLAQALIAARPSADE